MNTIITRLDGTIYDFDAIGITTRDFVVSSPKPRHFTEQVDARSGLIDMGTVYDARPINASFYAKAVDNADYALMRDEIFRMLRSDEAFYVTESRNPGKRWRVKVADSFGLDQQRLYGFFDVEFVAYAGVAESIGTTLDAETFEFLDLPVSELDYAEIRKLSFRVYNASGRKIDPRYDSLVISYRGVSTNLQIQNVTTNETWTYTGTTLADDEIRLDGVRATKNGLSIYRDTNRKLITLAEGWNEFVVSGVPTPKRSAVQKHAPKNTETQRYNPFAFEFTYKFL
ncbi:phage tail domain-containing protein [Bacillus sp. 03113]|uniref:phage tail domain-containing protein n=1 Tax=Bacillus sp. 03113 TaxID=2578211 RepID=UPI0011422720|nr:phage tail domain-containing protein [Bacillus sp. 03113]